MQKAISKYWPVFVLPTLIAFIIGFIWPFIWGIFLSFQRFTTVSKTTFVGIQNYISVFQDSTFLHAFGFTAAFTVISTVLINIFSRKVSPVVLSGTQFTMGGIILTLIGVGMGGHLGNVTAGGILLILYLAMVSAVAYTLWSVLLAWNDVSKVAIFGFVNPLCSVILSALVLGEVHQAFNAGSLIALLLVCVGIYVVNRRDSSAN